MKQSSTLFLKIVIILIAIGVLTGMVWFPPTEGRAANLDLFTIYTDPLIIYLYVGSIPFFVALFNTFRLLTYIEQNKVFSPVAVTTLKHIKYSALTLIAFIAFALFHIRFVAQGDDPAGPSMLGMIAIFASIIIATSAGVFQKLLQKAIDFKSENDLTV